MAIADVKTIRIFKSYGGAGTKGEFSNTYHALSPGSLKDDGLVRLTQRLALAERNMTSNQVFFSRAVVSTYARKSAVGGSDKPYIIPIAALGNVELTPANDGAPFKVLPPEACIVMNFSGGLGKPGRHTYRYAIKETEWLNSGKGVSIVQAALDRCTNAFAGVLDAQFGFPPLVFLTEDEDGQPTDPVTSITCGGYALRQLTQKKGTKKKTDDFDFLKNSEDDAEREIAQAIEVIEEVTSNRYTGQGGAIFSSPKWAAALAGILGAATLAKGALTAHDYGPPALPVGPD